MGGVDLNDMLIELHRSPTRSERWYLCLIRYMMDVALVNSYLLYRRHIKSLECQEIDPDEEEAISKAKAHSCSKTFRLSISKSLRGAREVKLASGPKQKAVVKKPRGLRPDDTIRHERVDH